LLQTALCLVASGLCSPASAQAPPDVPSIKLGTTIFADYTVQQAPKIIDADGNAVTFSSFNLARAYINITGKMSPRVTFRLTPDITREIDPDSTINGSYTFRLKYAYGQLALDRWLPSGSWTRLGLQGTPFMEFSQEVYRYRFQGSLFEEREGYLSFADAGAAVHAALPHDYGDLQGGFYNGEGSYKPELNDQKAWMLRGTVRPLPGDETLHGLRVTGFIDHDAYSKNRDRDRDIFTVTFEHPFVNAGYDYLATADRPAGQAATTHGRGWTAFVTPRTKIGWEGLLRYDRIRVDTDRPQQVKSRTIGGVAYWLKPVNGVTSALLVDIETVTFESFTPSQADQRRIAVHMLINY
jgi:hypothetical protein